MSVSVVGAPGNTFVATLIRLHLPLVRSLIDERFALLADFLVRQRSFKEHLGANGDASVRLLLGGVVLAVVRAGWDVRTNVTVQTCLLVCVATCDDPRALTIGHLAGPVDSFPCSAASCMVASMVRAAAVVLNANLGSETFVGSWRAN